MKGRPLWRISVATLPEAEEAVAGALAEIFDEAPASYTDVESGKTTVSVYLEKPPRAFPSKRAQLAAALSQFRTSGLKVGVSRISLSKLPREDWAESWKRHFPALEIGSTLLIKPNWSRRRPKKGQKMVVLDPGLSFGTGQHPTTAFCLEQLAIRRQAGQPQSFLDIGTGSGILVIAAAKLGYKPIHACDFDADAIRIARANARQNRTLNAVRFREQDVSKLPLRNARKYSVVCANLLTNLLVGELKRIAARLRADGVLIVAGILEVEFAQLRKAYEASGLGLIASRTEKEWRSAVFAWRNPPLRQKKSTNFE